MLGFFQSETCPIGIDVGVQSVRMLQFRGKGESLALQAACRIELDGIGGDQSPMERLAAAIATGLKREKFIGKKVAMALPPALVHCKSVRLPQMPDLDLEQALQWEAKDRFGFEIGDGRIVWFRAGEVRRGTEVKDELLLFAVQAEPLTKHIDAAGAAGLEVAAIDLPACALYRSTARTGNFSNADSVALLDIGHLSSQFMIARNDQLMFYKHIEIGGKAINDAVAQKLGISGAEAIQMRTRLSGADAAANDESAPLVQAVQDAVRPCLEELARELDMCMRYFVVTFRASRPERIILTGRQGSCARVTESLASSLGVPVEAAQPLRGVQNLGDVARPDRSSEWGVAAGLSLYPLTAAKMEVAA